MRKAISVAMGLLLFLRAAQVVSAVEMTWEFSVQLSATVQAAPSRITLTWPQDEYMLPNSYTVYRKLPEATSWGTGTTLPGTSTSYVDANVVVGTAYEYQVVKSTSQYTGYGYLYAGINVPLTDYRGKLLLVVDSTYGAALSSELAQLRQDLVGDGWTVVRLDVGRSDSVTSVKERIRAQYLADPLNVKSVFLFGHVPVPYSGDIVPDGHVPNHQGAWACDGYYGDMDGTWTDDTVNDVGADDARNHNVPGDGKFDQSRFPAPIKLMVGRVDLANLPGELWYGGPTTLPSELELLRNYLNKDHKYRTKQFSVPQRAIVGDFIGTRNGEAFAASGYRNFAPFFGAKNVTRIETQGAWTPTLATTPYLWSYGCGAGSLASVAGLGNSDGYHNVTTPELYTNDINSVFTMFFGSWLGDWDGKDDILRCAIALRSYGLASMWSGRPHWFLQHMGLGETIGFGARLTQNNTDSGLYQNQINTAANQIHIALMGDPTLRLHVVAPPSSLVAAPHGTATALSWMPSTDPVVGYHVYRQGGDGVFTRLTPAPITTTKYNDQTGSSASNYMVRAISLETSPSGSYFNPSVGTFLAPLTTSSTAVAATGTPAVGSSSQATTTSSSQSSGGTNANPLVNESVWIDDALPAGAVSGADGDAWNWITSNPAPYVGGFAHQSTATAGLHQHYFSSATETLTINAGDTLYTAVYLDPTNPPSEIMLQWNDGSSWEHRAFWGADSISYGTLGAASRVNLGPLPVPGQWVVLQIPANLVGLEGSTVSGMAFSQVDGMATWDYTGKFAAGGSVTQSPGTNPSGNTGAGSSTGTGSSSTATNTIIWMDDAVPSGSVSGSDGGDNWDWVSSNPAPYSGSVAHQSTVAAGLHQHYFTSASQPLPVNGGDTLFAAIYIDPIDPPSEVMLQWYDGTWEHRAFWGDNNITYGTLGTAGRVNMGGLPAAGRWTILQIPASLVGLEGSTVTGMSFSLVEGAATWDYVGKISAGSTVPAPGAGSTGSGSGGGTTTTGDTNSTSGSTGTTNVVGGTTGSGGSGSNGGTSTGDTGSTGSTTNLPATITSAVPGSSVDDYLGLQIPPVGANSLHVLSPTLLELKLITTKQPDPAPVTQWNFVDANAQLTLPSTTALTVTADGQRIAVSKLGFKRRPLSAPMSGYDLRIENSLYLQLAGPISDNQTIQVTNPDGTLWSTSVQFVSTVDPQRYNPAIHVNQEGYMPGYSKVAAIGYYAGSMGEISVPASAGFKIVDANTGAQVFQGSLIQHLDSGYTYLPAPYQNVYQADFSSFTTPGQYRLIVPGMGASLPFLIHDGVAMDFARAYALGLYHQRCGTETAMPHTRFTHDICHAAPAAVPASASAYPFTWTTVAGYANTLNANNPPQIAQALTSPDAQLFPFVNQGPVDVSGGHHDAGDYSKYTINSASLVAYLMFSVDSLPGVAALDNLGIPESGDGISDVMQEAKWEADFIAKMQDSDGGFYFLVYPKDREYEGNVAPDHGDPQVVWPKTTSVTAASVAALAQCATSPLFKQTYPDAAAAYLAKAQLGWQFLTNAIAKYGKNGAYQKITHYGDNFADNDELAWAACQMYLATGDSSIHQLLLSWFDPADPATWRWGWWHMSECYGHAIRSYAFAVQSGRVSANQLDATFLSKCQTQVSAAGDDMLAFSQQNAYGTSFPLNTKAVQSAGWYFSTDQAFDLAVAYQLNPKDQYISALLANMNYEGGCNPLNLSYVTGLGLKRQRDIVSQWALNDSRVLPPSGIPVGNIGANFGYLWDYSGELEGLCFPSDGATVAPYPFYDRWGDSWNVSSEMVVLNQARSIGSLAFLAARTAFKTQPWKAPANAQIIVPTGTVPVGQPVTLSLEVPGLDLSQARITWEARDQEPAFGSTFTFSPKNNGAQWIEAEAQMPDGRRAFAKASFAANAPDIVWVDDSLPTGAVAGTDGGDSWNWVSSSPAPFMGTLEHQSANLAGGHQHYFANASATMTIATGDVLYAYVFLDPAHMPSEIMLQWNDGTWDHRAYWGSDNLGYGVDGTAGRRYMGPLPAAGKWVQLKVPAGQVGLEGRTISGMGFSLYDGTASWDAAGRLAASGGTTASSVTVNTTSTVVSRLTGSPAVITFNRAGNTQSALTINYSVAGTAVNGQDYQISPAAGSAVLSIPAGATSAALTVVPLISSNIVGPLSIRFGLQSNSDYSLGNPNTVDVQLTGNTIPSSLHLSTNGAILTWASNVTKQYNVAYKQNLNDSVWIPIGQIKATDSTSSWIDPLAGSSRRFYMVAQVD
jgi:hypothetical protein